MSRSKLKDAHVLRVFISSPFNGMEGERETLTRLYWPRLKVFCSQRGIQLRLVDMRWGITSQSGDEAQTIKICLRELERSDIFIGFFGQRYGWAGINDAVLQRNFDMAVERYPWVDDYRNRSVTEIEFLAGHLNQPGHLPAAICFRDKSYDDERLAEGRRRNDAKMLRSFAVENEESALRMKGLKNYVLETKEKALGVLMDYKVPEEGAKFLFECVWKFVTEELFSPESEKPLTPLQIQQSQHDAFRGSRSAVYVGGHSYMDTIQSFLTEEKTNILFVTGEAGSGKSSLICQWLDRWHEDYPRDILIYHFIGCAAGSTGLDQILLRLTSELRIILNKSLQDEGDDKKAPKKLDQRQLARTFQKMLYGICKEPPGRKLIIVVDGLDKLDAGNKAGKPLYWIPKSLEGNNVKIILTTTSSDTANTSSMEEYEHATLSVTPLSDEEKASLCLGILQDNSKELSKEQLDIVLNSDKTNNPLYLKVIIDELCAFGYFRLLTKRIEELVSASSIEELLTKCMEQLETNYNPKSSSHNVVADVLCALVLSRAGLSENEITEMLDLSDQVWSPIYFALDKYLVKRQGLLGCAYSELESAVAKKYMASPDQRLVHLVKMCNYFYEKYKANRKVSERVTLELPYLLNTAGDPRLKEFICNLDVFENIYERDGSELLVYWENIGWTDREVKRYYSCSINKKLADEYLKGWELFPPDVATVSLNLFEKTNKLRQLTDEGNFNRAAIFFGERALNMLTHVKDYGEKSRRQWRGIILHQKAACYSELGLTNQAMELHLQLVEERKREYEERSDYENTMDLANSLHSVGVVHMKLRQYDKSLEYCDDALKLYRSLNAEDREKAILNEAKSLSNVALVYLWQGKLEESLKLYHEVLQTEEDYFFGEMPLDIAYTLTNMGLVYRRLGNLDSAEKYYLKALEIKKNLLGHRTMDVALSYINLSTLENARKNQENALIYTRTAVDIYKSIDLPLSNREYQMALENLAFDLFKTGRKEEAYEAYFHCLDVLVEHDNCEQLLDHLFRGILRDMLAQENWEKMERMLVAYMPTSKAAPDIYDTLYKIDKMHLRKNHLDRPEHMTVFAGLDRFPESDLLWRAKMELLMDQGDEEGIQEHGQHFVKMAETYEKYHHLASESYAFGAKWMLEDVPTSPTRLDTVYKFLLEGTAHYPDKPEISQQMYICLERMDRLPEAVPYLEKFLVAVPDNPTVLGLCAKHSVMTVVDVEKADEYVNRLENVANGDQNILEQVGSLKEAITHLRKS